MRALFILYYRLKTRMLDNCFMYTAIKSSLNSSNQYDILNTSTLSHPFLFILIHNPQSLYSYIGFKNNDIPVNNILFLVLKVYSYC